MTKTKAAKKAPAAQPDEAYIGRTVKMTLSPKKTAKSTTAEPAPASLTTEPKGKLAALTALLLRPEGATLAAMQEATGWQAHSVRGAISGSLKKKLGLDVASEKVEGVRTYRILKGAAA